MSKYDDMGPLLKIHPRDVALAKARKKLNLFLMDFCRDNVDLTPGEFLSLFVDEVSTWTRHVIRSERRGTDA